MTLDSWKRLDRVFGPVRASAIDVCRRLNAESASGFSGPARCVEVLISEVTLYTRERAINAFADEYDDIGVFAGLIKTMGTDAELAAVVAHEFSHIMLGHIEMKKKNALGGMAIATGLAGVFSYYSGVTDQKMYQQWQRTGMLAGSRAYSPEMEIEADRLAVYILKEASYPPTAMRDAIVRLHRAKPPRRKGMFSPRRVGFLETHPSNDRRIAHILSAVRDANAGVPFRVHESQ